MKDETVVRTFTPQTDENPLKAFRYKCKRKHNAKATKGNNWKNKGCFGSFRK